MIDEVQTPAWKQAPPFIRQEIARRLFLGAVRDLCPEVLNELRADVFPKFAPGERRPYSWLEVKKDDDFAGLRATICEWAIRHNLSVKAESGPDRVAAEWICETAIRTLWKWFDFVEAAHAAIERAGTERAKRKRAKHKRESRGRSNPPASVRDAQAAPARAETLREILARADFRIASPRRRRVATDWATVEVCDGGVLDWGTHDLDVFEYGAKNAGIVAKVLRLDDLTAHGPDFLRESTPREFIDRVMAELRARLTPVLEDAWEGLLPQALRFGLDRGPTIGRETAAGDSGDNPECPQQLTTLRRDQDRETARHMTWLALYQVKRLPLEEIKRRDGMVGSAAVRAGVRKSAQLIGLTLYAGKPGRPRKPQITR